MAEMTAGGRGWLAARKRKRAPMRGDALLGLLFVLPAVVLIAVFVLYPVWVGVDMSLHSVQYSVNGNDEKFVGLHNYLAVLKDPETISATLHTLGYWAVTLIVEIVIGLASALALNRAFRGRGLLLAVLILPWALPPVVAGLLWSRIFDPSSGLLNSVLVDLGVIHHYKVWFTSPFWSVVLISLVQAWGVAPLATLIFLGGLQGIPDSLHEAAEVDGASSVQRFFHIVLPLLRPSIGVAMSVGTVVGVTTFAVIYVLNGSAMATRSIMMQVYFTTFQNLDFGQGVALAFVVTVVTGLCAAFYTVSFKGIDQ
jgi:multiple sugar transport system permease protein